jgi:hypothetical protein
MASGAATGVATTAVMDVYDRSTGGEGYSAEEYLIAAGAGALFGGAGGAARVGKRGPKGHSASTISASTGKKPYFYKGAWREYDTGHFSRAPRTPTFFDKVRGSTVGYSKRYRRQAKSWWSRTRMNPRTWFKRHDHHGFPKQFSKEFADIGIENLDDFQYSLDWRHHLRNVHKGYRGGRYNQFWERFHRGDGQFGPRTKENALRWLKYFEKRKFVVPKSLFDGG